MLRASRLMEARIPRNYHRMTRQAWLDVQPNGKASPWPVAVSDWAKGERGPFVTLVGSTGIGKSHVAVATLQHYMSGLGDWGRPKAWLNNETERLGGVFLHARELADEYTTGKFRGRPLLEAALRQPLRVVDDVAWDRNTEDLQRGAVGALIMDSEQTGFGTILTTNLPLEFFLSERLDHKITARLQTGVFVELEGEDRR